MALKLLFPSESVFVPSWRKQLSPVEGSQLAETKQPYGRYLPAFSWISSLKIARSFPSVPSAVMMDLIAFLQPSTVVIACLCSGQFFWKEVSHTNNKFKKLVLRKVIIFLFAILAFAPITTLCKYVTHLLSSYSECKCAVTLKYVY